MYLLDANVLIRAHEDYYPIDRVPQFWSWLIEISKAGYVKMPLEIHGEISISKGLLREWICDGDVKKALILDEEINQDLAAIVLDQGYGEALTDSDLVKIGNDAFLIAYALANNQRIVVTKESSRPSAQRGNRKIPDVCNAVGVQWMRDFELYRKLNFKT